MRVTKSGGVKGLRKNLRERKVGPGTIAIVEAAKALSTGAHAVIGNPTKKQVVRMWRWKGRVALST